MQNPFAQLVSMLVGQSPLLLAYVAGLVVCAMRWNRYPRPAQLAFLGTLFLLIAAVGTPAVNVWIVTQFQPGGAVQLGELYSILGLVSAIVRATGYAFLLGAVFFGRATIPMGFPVTPPLRSSPSDQRLS
jgi:hypothetical protein